MLLFAFSLYPLFVLIKPYDYASRNWAFVFAMALIGIGFLLEDIRHYLHCKELENHKAAYTEKDRLIDKVKGYFAYLKVEKC